MKVDVIVSGQKIQVSVDRRKKAEWLIRQALVKTGNVGQKVDDWELRTVNGRLLEASVAMLRSGVIGGDILFLNPHAGWAGATGTMGGEA
jgi:hypothetical protein